MRRSLTALLLPLIATAAMAQVSLQFSTARRGPLLGPLHYGISLAEMPQSGDDNLNAELVKMLAALHPRFVRITATDGNRMSNSLHFHKLLQLAEELGAEPLLVAYVGANGSEQQASDDLDAYVQAALDAIEYCNGDATTPYGAQRAANGHPAPFGLRYIEIGGASPYDTSQQNGNTINSYAESYAAFCQAIQAKYPDMVLIADASALGSAASAGLLSVHHTVSPEWAPAQYDIYNMYMRESARTYAGTFAMSGQSVSAGSLRAALAGAIYMAGSERNADVCTMTSYAPLFSNEDEPEPPMPGLIRFNASASFGTPAYWAQQMMASTLGHQNITWAERGNAIANRNTAFALSSWGTAVTYDNLRIADRQGQVVYATDFANADAYTVDWNATGGTWSVADGALRQTDTNMYGQCNVCYNLTGEDCVIELDARKDSGAEGFLIAFSYNDPQNYVWWNLGGWGNTQHAIEQCVDGVKTTLAATPGQLTTGQTYRLRIVKADGQVTCYIDGTLCHSIVLPDARRIYTAAALTEAEDTLVLKLINPAATAQEVSLHFKDFQRAGRVRRQVLSSTADTDENSMPSPRKVVPRTSTFAPTGTDPHTMLYTVPAYSLCILQIPVADVSPEATDSVGSAVATPYAEPCPASDEGPWYDLSGRRVGRPSVPGLYIRGKRKLFIR